MNSYGAGLLGSAWRRRRRQRPLSRLKAKPVRVALDPGLVCLIHRVSVSIVGVPFRAFLSFTPMGIRIPPPVTIASMPPRSMGLHWLRPVPWPAEDWRRELARAVTDLEELLGLVALSADRVDAVRETDFALRAPRPYITRMRLGDPDDPLLRQVLPSAQESASVGGYGMDPLRESSAVVDAGLLRKI